MPLECIEAEEWLSEDGPGTIFDCRPHRLRDRNLVAHLDYEPHYSDAPCKDDWRQLLDDDDVVELGPATTAPFPEDVSRFLKRYVLTDYALKSSDLAIRFFPYGTPQFRLDRDPTNPDDEWFVIQVVVTGSVRDALECEDKYSAAFVAMVPLPQRERIRLEYRFRESDEATGVS